MSDPRGISPSELKILTYINDHHPVTVREVAERFAQSDEYARTTVLTLMERLRKKGYLKRDESQPVHRYAPAVRPPDLQRSLVRDFVRQMLGGSLSPFMAFLSEDAELNEEEIRELKAVLAEREEKLSREERE